MDKLEYFSRILPELTDWRRDFHAHPELGFKEFRTADLVATRLASFGCEVHRGLGGTGVVGVLRAGTGNASVGLRADMDALPIHEENDAPYRSLTNGVMHACGHDGHTTMLLGAAKYLSETRAFGGTAYFIFQPAEEGLGGAKAMLADGLFSKFPCDSIFGMHNKAGLAVGKFAIRPGPMMAGGAFFDIVLRGKGGHAARPHDSSDLIGMACQIATMLQAIVSRHVAPTKAAVVSVASIFSAGSYNVLPEEVTLKGTARAFETETLDLIGRRMQEIVDGAATVYAAKAALDFRVLFAPLVNDPSETAFYADLAAGLVGGENVDRNRALGMASEDFSFMLEACPGAYIDIGNGETVGSNPAHTPLFDFNDEILPLGCSLLAAVVESKLRQHR